MKLRFSVTRGVHTLKMENETENCHRRRRPDARRAVRGRRHLKSARLAFFFNSRQRGRRGTPDARSQVHTNQEREKTGNKQKQEKTNAGNVEKTRGITPDSYFRKLKSRERERASRRRRPLCLVSRPTVDGPKRTLGRYLRKGRAALSEERPLSRPTHALCGTTERLLDYNKA